MARLNLVSPWVEYYHKVQAFFRNDPDINVIFDDEELELKIYVANDVDKFEALRTLLPETKEFGAIKLKITLIPSNNENVRAYVSPRKRGFYSAGSESEALLIKALRGNGAFMFSKTISGIMTSPIVYIVFRNEVVQYYNDDLGDYYGQCSTLYQNLAADIFDPSATPLIYVHYCTDKPSRYDEPCCDSYRN